MTDASRGNAHELTMSQTCSSLHAVDSCLADLYARAIEQQGALPTLKTVLLNLVIRAADPALEASAQDFAARVLTRVSSRVIVADRASSDQPEGATVSVVCGVTERGDKRLCGEVIQIHASQGAIIGGVMPLLLRDVPVYLWMLGDIASGHEDAADLLQVASHLIVDSRQAVQLAHTMKDTEWLRRAFGGPRVVQDLAWVSLHNWREAAASLFDPPAARESLADLSEITVSYLGSEDAALPPSLPLLLGCWLIGQLGLTIQGAFHSRDEGYRIDAARGDQPVPVRLIPDGSDGPGLLSVVIKCGSDAFTVKRGSDSKLDLASVHNGEHSELGSVDAPDEDDVALVVSVLRSYGTDRVFERVLELAITAIDQFLLVDERSAKIRL